MPLIGFTVFKEKILDGTKTQTTRKFRKHPIKVGDKLYLYWHTRQKDCEKLGEAICTEVMTIQMHSEYLGWKTTCFTISLGCSHVCRNRMHTLGKNL